MDIDIVLPVINQLNINDDDENLNNTDTNMDINTLSISKPRNKTIKKWFNFRKILDYNHNTDEYNILWEDNSISLVHSSDVSESAKIDYENKMNRIKVHKNKEIFVSYIRTSTGTPSVSPEVQESTIINFNKICRNAKHYNTYKEIGKSAKDMNNLTKLNECIEELKDLQNNKNKYIVLYDISRFSRNVNQALTIIDECTKLNIYFYFMIESLCTEISTNRQQIINHLANAEALSMSVSNKVKASIKYRRDHGLHIGGRIPFGIKLVNKKHVIDKNEFNIIKEIVRMRHDGCTYKKISNYLCDNNITFRGKPFIQSRVILCFKKFTNNA